MPGIHETVDGDYSASVTAILRPSRRSKRRFLVEDGSDGAGSCRRPSVFTVTSEEMIIEMGLEDEGFGEDTQEQIYEKLKVHKEVIGAVKHQPWALRKKMKLVRQAKAYVRRHEGVLQERLAHSRNTRDAFARASIFAGKKWQYFKRELVNLQTWMIPWERRIKEIESHFGSAVASYFIFLRWLFWINLVISLTLTAFVAIPEVLTADKKASGDRKYMFPEEIVKSKHFLTLWEFEGVLKHSPFFYGWYTNWDPPSGGYRLPLAYFLANLVVYTYSFVVILRKMAKNSRMSKLSEKEDECAFSWKLFTGWDFMIGNSETAHNRVASIVLGFKEALLEEAEKEKKLRHWKIIAVRIFVNVAVLFLLALSAYAVVEVVARSMAPSDSWWRQNEITIVMSLISYIFPIFFEILGLLENYHPRKQLRLQLARIMVLNLLNLYSLIIALFDKISHMEDELKNLKPTGATEFEAKGNNSCSMEKVSCAVLSALGLAQVFESFPQLPKFHQKRSATLAASLTALSLVLQPNATFQPSISTSSLPQEYFESSPTPQGFSATKIAAEVAWEGYSEREDDPAINYDLYDDSGVVYDVEQLSSSQLEPSTTIGTTLDTSSTSESTDLPILTTPIAEKQTLHPIFRCYIQVCNESDPKIPANLKENDFRNTKVSQAAISSLNMTVKRKLRRLCWETMFGQELAKLTVMDLVLTIIATLIVDFYRALFVRYMNLWWCWDLEKRFPQYGDFKIAENILHLVNNQGMVWMGMFFSPGLTALNLLKLGILMYLRSWAVMTCNVPHEVVFRASRSNNFYFSLLLTMIFLCVLPVGYAIVWVEPSWHCGPFSGYQRIYHMATSSLKDALPRKIHKALDYVASPGIVIPLIVLMALIIYYMVSLAGSLREANNDLKLQLRYERTEERRKMFKIAEKRIQGADQCSGRWKKLLHSVPSRADSSVSRGSILGQNNAGGSVTEVADTEDDVFSLGDTPRIPDIFVKSCEGTSQENLSLNKEDEKHHIQPEISPESFCKTKPQPQAVVDVIEDDRGGKQ